MAYFIPSYFQKRLLRYALTRLDFIETDDLDLENLGLTLGQRSVIELKNVSIKVKKLIEKIELPPFVIIHSASIRCLRLTIPADLHVSGIKAEIDGVDISTQIRDAESIKEKDSFGHRRHTLPSHTDSANRPRISSPRVHDPGGRRGSRNHGVELSHVLPTSEDLAVSFLQSEPAQERQELEAAIGSQSQMQDSATSSAYNEDAGLGMPGGFTLPAFVANFFQSIADRLSLKIRNVSVSIELALLGPQTVESLRLLLKIGVLDIGSLESTYGLETSTASNRTVSIKDVTFGVEIDDDMGSQSSSPKLSRAQSQFPTSVFNDCTSQKPENVQGRGSQQGSQHTTSSPSDKDSAMSSVTFQPTLGLGIDPSATDANVLNSSIPKPGLHDSESAAIALASPSEIDNKAHAEQECIPAPSNTSSPETSRSSQHGNELFESTLFSHEEAESMYMSAISQEPATLSRSRAMPGGWDWSDSTHEQQSMKRFLSTAPPDNEAATTPHYRPLSGPVNIVDGSDDISVETQAESAPDRSALNSNSVAPRQLAIVEILHLDAIRIHVPHHLAAAVSDPQSLADTTRFPPHHPSRASTQPQATATVRHITDPQKEWNSTASVELGVLTIDLDLQVSKLLVHTLQALMKIFQSTSSYKPADQSSGPTFKALSLRVQKLQVNFRESLNPVVRKEVASLSDSPILCLSVRFVEFVEESASRKKLTVSKVSVTHGAKEVMSFIDSVNVRDSIASSSMLRPHDLTATITDRVEVQIKPAYIVMDLLRIDDVLSRSGGLSSLLDLGNSIMSTSTMTATSPILMKTKPTARSVRFNAPDRRPESDIDLTAAGYKVYLRLSGSVIDVVGSEASIQVKTSAIKVVTRSGGARVVVDGAAVEGPLLRKTKSSASVYAKMKSLEVQYFETPQEADLDRLITLITPSSDKYDEEDDIMVDTLLRQRRKGGVLSLNMKEIHLGARGIEWQQALAKLSDELSKLSTVTKYLPEDDRPGILTFALIQKFEIQFHPDDAFGPLTLKTDLIEGAYINVPSLAAAQVDTWSLTRGKDDRLIGEVLSQEMGAPMVMCRFIADEMEPTVRLKLTNNCIEYKASTLIAVQELVERLHAESRGSTKPNPPRLSPTASSSSDSSNVVRKIRISVAFRHSAIALHPLANPAKGLFLLSDAVLSYEAPEKAPKVTFQLKKASLLVIDNAEVLGADKNVDHKLYFDQNDQVQELARSGFVPVATISAAVAVVEMLQDETNHEQHVEVDFKKNLLILETCADSTQTMIQVLNGLSPPVAPSMVAKFRTEIIPIDDMLASFTGNAFVSEPGPEIGLQATQATLSSVPEDHDDEDDDDGGFMNDLYMDEGEADDEMTASYVESDLARSTASASLHIAPVEATAPQEDSMAKSMMAHSMLDFRNEHFASKSNVGGRAHRWDSTQNTYELGSETAFQRSPLKVRVRDMHVIWNMFDGFDWQATRDTISQAVKEIETRANTQRSRARASSPTEEEKEESVVGDVLFNSIYISIPAKQDPAELARAINHDIDDQVSESSYATRTTTAASPSRRQPYRRTPALKLNRSKQHKMSFELQGVSADVVAFPPDSGEVESSVDIRVNKLEIFDHVPTSTWKKFATYMHDAGEREVDTSQVHIEMLNVKPVAELATSELVLKVTVLPLRLHVDQDALDFLSRFFEFKDESATSGAPSTPPFLQRVEVNPIRLRLDYKPKTVDYASLRSGRTTEFMNFIVLDRADMVLRRVILYGVSGFDRMGIMLNNIWSPDVKRNQLPGVLAGLAPVRPVVDVARGMNELIAVPIREYQKDGRIVRALQKGAIAFAKTTSTELANLGAKLAIGTQNVLQNAEGVLVPPQQQGEEDEERKQISLYANQPIGIVQGLRGAYASLERDLLLARDAVVAVPGEVMAQPNAKGAAKAILERSPTIILRPAMGVSKAAAQTFQGVANTLDKRNLRRIEDKYKRH